MIRNHGAVQKSLGQAALPGLISIDKKITVELLPDSTGPRQSPGEYSIRDIMMKMRAGKTRLWQGIFKGWNGKWYGFFPGTDDSATYQATEFAKDPAGTIKIHLIKQGWSRNCIKALIKKSCTESAAEAATHAVWCTKTQ